MSKCILGFLMILRSTIIQILFYLFEKPFEIRGAGWGGCVGNDAGLNPSWETIFSQLPANKFTVYFFETYDYPRTQEDWELLLSDTNKIHIKNVTLEELRENNYTISYP